MMRSKRKENTNEYNIPEKNSLCIVNLRKDKGNSSPYSYLFLVGTSQELNGFHIHSFASLALCIFAAALSETSSNAAEADA